MSGPYWVFDSYGTLTYYVQVKAGEAVARAILDEYLDHGDAEEFRDTITVTVDGRSHTGVIELVAAAPHRTGRRVDRAIVCDGIEIVPVPAADDEKLLEADREGRALCAVLDAYDAVPRWRIRRRARRAAALAEEVRGCMLYPSPSPAIDHDFPARPARPRARRAMLRRLAPVGWIRLRRTPPGRSDPHTERYPRR
ncbi:hypothetical protein ACTD5D_40340 [Nocardia takedensis]|uniref:hypothetical protein n=1 Tax=Nocardia takedensis TaxID=259390 RepID=UPI003F76D331